MKDYYYILGIERHADAQTIQKAYKKLSLKFHPELNENDRFFINHYQSIQEAYEVLGNERSRQAYDRKLDPSLTAVASKDPILSTAKPIIQLFDISSTNIRANEFVTVTWNVVHANHITIDLFGKVSNSGTKTTRLKDLAYQPMVNVKIEAYNSHSQKTAQKQIAVYNRDKVANPSTFQVAPVKKVDPVDTPRKKKKASKAKKKVKTPKELSPEQEARQLEYQQRSKESPYSDPIALLVGAVVLSVVAVMIYVLIQMNEAI
ncbi:MAG: J domain-containing protein [Saprospiraceae bacterium]|nr:J domain-containing protein [Saprospiraceae bacterium]